MLPRFLRDIPLRGLYVILDPAEYQEPNLVGVLTACAGFGVRIFQYRNKVSSMKEAYHQAMALRQAALATNTIFVVNDRSDLALAVEADGVHLGQEDLPLSYARALLGPNKIIGISTHNVQQVGDASRGGADYIGVGPVFKTGSKPDHEPVVGLDGLRRAREHTDLPIFAIGGMTSRNVAQAVEAGADGTAVISAMARASDVKAEVLAFLTQFS